MPHWTLSRPKSIRGACIFIVFLKCFKSASITPITTPKVLGVARAVNNPDYKKHLNIFWGKSTVQGKGKTHTSFSCIACINSPTQVYVHVRRLSIPDNIRSYFIYEVLCMLFDGIHSATAITLATAPPPPPLWPQIILECDTVGGQALAGGQGGRGAAFLLYSRSAVLHLID